MSSQDRPHVDYAKIVAITTAMGRDAFSGRKIWCGNRFKRACHNGGLFGAKCSSCGQYMHEEYNEKAAAYFEKHFAHTTHNYVADTSDD